MHGCIPLLGHPIGLVEQAVAFRAGYLLADILLAKCPNLVNRWLIAQGGLLLSPRALNPRIHARCRKGQQAGGGL